MGKSKEFSFTRAPAMHDPNAWRYAHSLIEASLDPVVTTSPEGRITDLNEATIKLTGVPREQLIHTDFSDYFTEPHKARSGLREVLKNGFVTDCPLILRDKGGRQTDVLYSASVYRDADGDVLGVFATARHASVQKQTPQHASEAAEKYRLLFNDAHDGVVLIDSDTGRIVECNHQFEIQTGRKLEELLHLKVCDLVSPSQAESGRRRFAEVLAKGESGSDEIEFCRPGGDTLSVELRSRVIRLGGKRYLHSVSRDTSELRAAERQLRARIDELRRFQKVTVDRELRMQDLEERLACVAAHMKGA